MRAGRGPSIAEINWAQTREIGSNYDNGGRTYFAGLTARF